jgi:flagellar motor switch protein FliN/FliY
MTVNRSAEGRDDTVAPAADPATVGYDPDSRALTSRQATDLFPRLSGQEPGDGTAIGSGDIEMILDIPVVLTVELGRTRLPLGQILQMAHGSVIELDALAGEPMDVLVNGCLIAQGEVVVVNDRFGIRLTDTVTPAERMRRLNRAR